MFRNHHFRASHFKTQHLKLGFIQQVVEKISATAGFCHESIVRSFSAIRPVLEFARQSVAKLFQVDTPVKEFQMNSVVQVFPCGDVPIKEFNQIGIDNTISQLKPNVDLNATSPQREITFGTERIPEQIGNRVGKDIGYTRTKGTTKFDRVKSWR